MHSLWDLWISGLQECKYNSFFEVGRAGNNFRLGPENLTDNCPCLNIPPRKVREGGGGGKVEEFEPMHVLKMVELCVKVGPPIFLL